MANDTWKDYSGREWGGEHYHFGDNARHFWRKITVGGSSSSTSTAAASVDDGDRALLDLKVQKDQLVGQRRRMESQVAKDDEAAKSLVKNGKKQQAMLALRKKKQHEQLALDVQTHLNRLDELITNIEFSRIQAEAIAALAEGVKMLKRVQQASGGVDYINKIMDERDEALQDQQDISDALAAAGVAADDPDTLAEYERLIEAQASAQLLSPALVPAPAAAEPTTQPAVDAVAVPVAAAPSVGGYPLPAPEVPTATAPKPASASLDSRRLAEPSAA